jgi:sigma-B regulation protein RsbU (phosphoserine phosphatase)
MRKNPDPQIDSLICQLLEHRAIIKDKEINNRLLQELITKYSESETRLKKLNRELIRKQDRIELDLLAAAEIQKSLLPRDSVGSDAMNFAWKFRPCEEIGGDIFNIIPLNEDHWAFYMIDVAGHGVQAAMIAVTVYQYLQSNNGILLSQTTKSVPTLKIYRPAEVLAFLDREYPFERFSSFFTMNYVVVNTAQGTLTASSAGHPPPVILRKNGKLILLKRGGRPIGTIDMRLSEDEPIVFPEEHHRIRAGDKLIFYTDGVTDYQNEQGQLYGAERFYKKLIELKDLPLSELIEKSFDSLFEFGQNEDPKDDISLLGLELQKQNA